MFNSSKYTKIYFNIINRAKSEPRKKNDGRYYESHHIRPKSMGGTNDADNLVLLTAKEHFVAHHLLIKMVDEKQYIVKMTHAFWRMCHAPQQKQIISSKTYEMLRLRKSMIMSEQMSGQNNPFYGKTHTDETKEKMKNAAKGRNPHDYFDGKTYPSWNKGLTKNTNASLNRMSVGKLGKGNPMFGRTGKEHPNTNSYVLFDSKLKQIGKFHSRKEFCEFCKENNLPFSGLYKTSKNESYYSDSSKNHKYDSFNGWSLRTLEP